MPFVEGTGLAFWSWIFASACSPADAGPGVTAASIAARMAPLSLPPAPIAPGGMVVFTESTKGANRAPLFNTGEDPAASQNETENTAKPCHELAVLAPIQWGGTVANHRFLDPIF